MKLLSILLLLALSPSFSKAQSQSPFQSLINTHNSTPARAIQFSNRNSLDGVYKGTCIYPDGHSEFTVLVTVFLEPAGPAFPGVSKYLISSRLTYSDLAFGGVDKVLKTYNPAILQNSGLVSIANSTPAWFGHQKPYSGALYLKISDTLIPGKKVYIVLETANANIQNPPVARACYFDNYFSGNEIIKYAEAYMQINM